MSAPDSTTNPTSTSTSSSTIKKPPNNRIPSLNQLAARISSKAAAANTNGAAAGTGASAGGAPSITTSTTSAPRPRLAAFASLRTGSTTSLGSTAASASDSVAVNPPSTRSVSPATSNASGANNVTPPANSANLNAELGSGDALTADKLQKLNEETTPSMPSVDIQPTVLKPLVPLPASSMPDVPKKKVGYKNIPSLDVITARMAKAKAVQLSVDGSAMPPEPEMIEDPKTPGVAIKAPEHPLQFAWTIYHDTKAKYPYTPASASVGINNFNQPAPGHTSSSSIDGSSNPNSSTFAPHPPEGSEYEANLTLIGEFNTVEEFCRYFNWLKPPSKLEKNSNYHIFKSGIKPMWEDPRNSNGGKWVLTMKNNPALLDRCWSWLAMALVGEELEDGFDSGDKKEKEKKEKKEGAMDVDEDEDDDDDEDLGEICGAVVSLRSKVDRIQLWIKSKDDVERVNALGKRLVKLLDVSEADNIGLEFQYNSDDRPPPNKFLSIQSVPNSSFRPSFQGVPGTVHQQIPANTIGGGVGVGPGGAFGGFGTGVGIGGAGLWKSGTKR